MKDEKFVTWANKFNSRPRHLQPFYSGPRKGITFPVDLVEFVFGSAEIYIKNLFLQKSRFEYDNLQRKETCIQQWAAVLRLTSDPASWPQCQECKRKHADYVIIVSAPGLVFGADFKFVCAKCRGHLYWNAEAVGFSYSRNNLSYIPRLKFEEASHNHYGNPIEPKNGFEWRQSTEVIPA